MATVSETIPQSLQAEVEAAISWFNARQTDTYEVTGIVDADLTLAASAPRQLRLVLCGGDTCQQQSFEVSPAADGFNVAFSETGALTTAATTELQAELDPPPGALRHWLDGIKHQHNFTLLVFYRGFWRPPCRSELRGYIRNGVVDKIRAAGGEIYAITSEPQRLASLAKSDWELNFETVGDPHHEISGACQERGWLELIVNTEVGITALEADTIYSHPKGYFQPGVLALHSSGRVLYRWRGIPTRRNMGGATERPTAEHVFEKLSRALEDTTTADAEPDLKPKLDSRGIRWPLFMALLLANGWFIKPKPFPYIRGGPSVNTRAKRPPMRMPFFLGALVLSFTLLPTGWVGAALLAYGLWLTPHFRYLGSQFQNVKE